MSKGRSLLVAESPAVSQAITALLQLSLPKRSQRRAMSKAGIAGRCTPTESGQSRHRPGRSRHYRYPDSAARSNAKALEITHTSSLPADAVSAVTRHASRVPPMHCGGVRQPWLRCPSIGAVGHDS